MPPAAGPPLTPLAPPLDVPPALVDPPEFVNPPELVPAAAFEAPPAPASARACTAQKHTAMIDENEAMLSLEEATIRNPWLAGKARLVGGNANQNGLAEAIAKAACVVLNGFRLPPVEQVARKPAANE